MLKMQKNLILKMNYAKNAIDLMKNMFIFEF